MPDFNNAAQTIATVEVAAIVETPLPTLPKDNTSGSFSHYIINSRYDRDGHVYAAGLTTPEPFQDSLVGIFRLAAVTVIWIADWEADMIGQYPPIPDPEPPPGWVLLDARCSTVMIKQGADSVSPLFQIEGTYVYAKKSPAQNPRDFLTQDISYPYAPWIKDGVLRKVPAHTLIPGLLDPTQTGGGNVGGIGAGGDNGQGLLGPLRFGGLG